MLAVQVCVYFLDQHVAPFKRGFFCNDESLMHPYSESTVGYSMIIIAYILPLSVIALTEVLRSKLNLDDKSELKLFGRDIPQWLEHMYKYCGVFVFGNLVTEVLTDIGKRVVGRFRPHFINVCQPIMTDGSTCADEKNLHRYIVDFTCGNRESSANRLHEMRLSFPSGHSSIAMFSMVFIALYIHYRFDWKGSKLLKYLIEAIFVSIAWFTALSRISDYKHHCEYL